MAYNPQVPPQEPEELLPYLNEEYLRVAQAFNAVDNGEWAINHKIPEKYKPGTLKIFDGTDANPVGNGKEGLYRFGSDNQWHYVDGETYVPPPAPTPTPYVNITPSNGWTVNSVFVYRKWSYHTDIIFDLQAGTYADPGPVTIGTIPVGFRPPTDCSFAIVTNTLGSIGALPRLRVRYNGDIDIFNVPPGSLGIKGTVCVPIDVL